MKEAFMALAYWLLQSAPYAVAILLGITLKACV